MRFGSLSEPVSPRESMNGDGVLPMPVSMIPSVTGVVVPVRLVPVRALVLCVAGAGLRRAAGLRAGLRRAAGLRAGLRRAAGLRAGLRAAGLGAGFAGCLCPSAAVRAAGARRGCPLLAGRALGV